MAQVGYTLEDRLENSMFKMDLISVLPNQLNRDLLSVKIYHYFKGQRTAVLAKCFFYFKIHILVNGITYTQLNYEKAKSKEFHLRTIYV